MFGAGYEEAGLFWFNSREILFCCGGFFVPHLPFLPVHRAHYYMNCLSKEDLISRNIYLHLLCSELAPQENKETLS